MKIKDIIGREILDSRGNPTVEVDVILENGQKARASVPSGASTGTKEALELRDNDQNRYLGKGVLQALANIQKIKNNLIGMDINDLEAIDSKLITIDNTNNKSNLGANATLAISLACLRAKALVNNREIYQLFSNKYTIPRPMINILNGGVHADNKLAFQEFMIVPMKADYPENIRMSCEVFYHLKKILHDNNLSCGVGDEGGFAPMVEDNYQALDLIMKAIQTAGYRPGLDICLALDVAASEIYQDGKYVFDNHQYNQDELVNYYQELITRYPIISIEDPMAEDDYEGWIKITKKLKDTIQIVGDDLFVTNQKLLQKGIDLQMANAILIKVNQIGTVSETLATIKLAKENGYKTIISHRSGETEDTYIADLAVGLNLGQIKTGSVCRSERTCKYNQLLRINEEINK